MRVPFGSSKISARSCGQNSPSMLPSGVTLTVCALAAKANTAASAASELQRFTASSRSETCVVQSGVTRCGNERAHVGGARDLHASREHVLAARCAQDRIDQRMELGGEIVVGHRPLEAADRVRDEQMQLAAVAQRDRCLGGG